MADAGQLKVRLLADTAQFHAGLAGAQKEIQKTESAFGGLGNAAGTAAKGIALGVTAMGAGIAAFGGMALNAAAEFEQAMSDIKAVSGATGEEIKALDALAMKLGKDTVFSAKEAANGISELVKGGVGIEDILNGAAEAALNLASAGGVGLADAAEIASNSMAMFGLKGQDMAMVADMVAGAANASSLSVMDFKYSLQMAGAVARTVGLSFEDTATAIALLGKEGLKGSDAGTSLKTMFLNLTPSTKKAFGTMEALGIITRETGNRFFDATGKVKGLAEISAILQDSMQGLGNEEVMQNLYDLFGSDAIRAGAIFLRQGAEGFTAMAEAMGKVKAVDVAKQKLDNFKGSMEQLKGSWDTLLITVGKPLLPIVRGALDGVTGILNTAIGEWDKIMAGEGTVGGWVKVMKDKITAGDWSGVANLLGVTIGEQLGNLGAAITPYLPDWAQLIMGKMNKGQWSEIPGVLGVLIGEQLGNLGAAIDPYLPNWALLVKGKIAAGAWGEIGPVLGVLIGDALGNLGESSIPLLDDIQVRAAGVNKELGDMARFVREVGTEMTNSGIAAFRDNVDALGVKAEALNLAIGNLRLAWEALNPTMGDGVQKFDAVGAAVKALVDLSFLPLQGLIWGLTLAAEGLARALGLVKAAADAIGPGGIEGLLGNVPGAKGAAQIILGSRAEGGYIPQTGLYQLHAGETVIPADEELLSSIAGAPDGFGTSTIGGGSGGSVLETLNGIIDHVGTVFDGIKDHVGDWTSSVVQVVKEERALLDGVKALKTSVDSGATAVKQAVAAYQPGYPLKGNFPGGQIIGREQFQQENQGELGTYYTTEWRAIFEQTGTATDNFAGATKNSADGIVASTATVTNALIDHEGAISVATEALGVLAAVAGAASAAWNAVSGGGGGGTGEGNFLNIHTPGSGNSPWQDYQNPSGDWGGAGGYTPGKLAAGGIVTRPGIFQVGEAGPEAVIPLGQIERGGGGNQPINITLQINPGQLARMLRGEILELNRLGGRA
jgi:TP901 family phage tail tape measure protein